MLKQITLYFLLLSFSGFGQFAVVLEDFQGDKYPETKWGADNKHFGYYQVRYSMKFFELDNSGIENPLMSGKFAAGYLYRYKINDFFSIGLEIGYENISSRIKNNSQIIFDEENSFDKIRTYQNTVYGTLFNRIVIGENTMRNLGWHIDIGAFFNNSLGRGVLLFSEDKNQKLKLRNKNPDYLSKNDYGVFFRVGKNNLMFYSSFSFADWIKDLNNVSYTRSPLTIGIQLNMYAK